MTSAMLSSQSAGVGDRGSDQHVIIGQSREPPLPTGLTTANIYTFVLSDGGKARNVLVIPVRLTTQVAPQSFGA